MAEVVMSESVICCNKQALLMGLCFLDDVFTDVTVDINIDTSIIFCLFPFVIVRLHLKTCIQYF